MNKTNFKDLKDFLSKIPGVNYISEGEQNGFWWIKLNIDINNQLAWNVIQELGHILNYISLDERLPTIFYPVSPPPYLNGGPKEFLTWIIESKDINFSPTNILEWLKGRLPSPVDDLNQWKLN